MELLPIDGSGIYLYAVIILALLSGAFGLPIPEDIPLLTAGVLIGNGRINPAVAWLLCYIAILIGDMIIFGVGYRFGFNVFRFPALRKRVTPENVTELCRRLERHSIGIILLARHLFYMRTLTFLVCGALRLRPSRFFIIDSFAAMISTSIMMGLGYYASERLTLLFDFLTKAKRISLLIGALGALVIVFLLLRQRRRKTSTSSSEISQEVQDDEQYRS